MGVRIDRWLWVARFFKTRGMATDMVRAGHVRLNGERIKPSRQLDCGDTLTIERGRETFTVKVSALAEKRISAAVARTLYAETGASLAARERQRELRRLHAGAAPARRPDKKARRQIIRFVRRQD